MQHFFPFFQHLFYYLSYLCSMKRFSYIFLMTFVVIINIARGQDSIFYNHFQNIDMRDGLAESRIRQIKQMPDGRIAVATTATIDIYDDTRFTSYKLSPEYAYPLSGYHGKRQMNCDSLGFIWLRNEGVLYVLDAEKGRVVPDVKGLLETLNINNEDIINMPTSPVPQTYEGISDVFTVEHDCYGGVWIGTKENGILYSNPQRESQFLTDTTEFAYERIPNHATTRARALEQKYAPQATNCMLDDDGNYAFLGTMDGLMVINRENQLVNVFDVNYGLHSSNVQALIRDDKGDVWISTAKGISRLHCCGSDSFEISNYGKLDGINLQGKEFRPGQVHKSADGYITAGFVGGTVVFHPDSVKAPRYVYYYPQKESFKTMIYGKRWGKWICWICAAIVLLGGGCLYRRMRKNKKSGVKIYDDVSLQVSDETFRRIKEQRIGPSVDELFLKRVQEVVEENIGDENFSVQNLSEQMAMDRTGLFRKLKTLTGLSPSEYIRKVKVDVVARLLRETNHSVADIATMTGFSSAKYCSKVFKSAYKLTPDEYRKIQKKED